MIYIKKFHTLLKLTYISDNQNGFPENCRTADHAYLDLNLLLIKKKVQNVKKKFLQ